MNLSDTLSLSYRTIRGNKLRTGITVAIIALGIAALIGINTAIQAMTQKFQESFSAMGANGFSVHARAYNIRFGRRTAEKQDKRKKEKRSNSNKIITITEAELFKQNYKFPSQVGISLGGVRNAIISHYQKETNPNTIVNGGDENYIDLNGYSIAHGRNMNILDVQTGRNICLLGKDVAVKLFGENQEKAVDKIVRINNLPFRVVGVLVEKGSTLGMSYDNAAICSYKNVKQYFNNNPNASYNLGVKVADVKLLDAAMGEAEGVFRPIRKLLTTEEDNFIVDKSDSFVELLLRQMSWLTAAAVVIGFITLMGAAIGLMNIMLVAVTERTKEVGLIKAIGGKQGNVRMQFLFESVMISLLGAAFGIVIGILLGNIVSILMNTGFVIPWLWVFLGIFICSIVGLAAGSYPAYKASRLNPIEALRYE